MTVCRSKIGKFFAIKLWGDFWKVRLCVVVMKYHLFTVSSKCGLNALLADSRIGHWLLHYIVTIQSELLTTSEFYQTEGRGSSWSTFLCCFGGLRLFTNALFMRFDITIEDSFFISGYKSSQIYWREFARIDRI